VLGEARAALVATFLEADSLHDGLFLLAVSVLVVGAGAGTSPGPRHLVAAVTGGVKHHVDAAVTHGVELRSGRGQVRFIAPRPGAEVERQAPLDLSGMSGR
jgi:hypothetical protein